MKWIPETHNIVFEIVDGVCVSYRSPDYTGLPQEVYEEVLAENRAMNLEEEADGL